MHRRTPTRGRCWRRCPRPTRIAAPKPRRSPAIRRTPSTRHAHPDPPPQTPADHRRPAEPDRPAIGMPVSHPLPIRGATMLRCHAKTDGTGYNGPSGGVLHGDSRLRPQPRAVKGRSIHMTRPTAKEIKAMAGVAGVPVTDDVAARIANSIGPAFEGLAPIAGTLPFDLEPATFLVIQNEASR